MKRRSFFTVITKAAAIVALAPQLAFRARPSSIYEQLTYWKPLPYQVDLQEILDLSFAIARQRRYDDTITILTDREAADIFRKYFNEPQGIL